LILLLSRKEKIDFIIQYKSTIEIERFMFHSYNTIFNTKLKKKSSEKQIYEITRKDKIMAIIKKERTNKWYKKMHFHITRYTLPYTKTKVYHIDSVTFEVVCGQVSHSNS
jgi:hypothetical protein